MVLNNEVKEEILLMGLNQENVLSYDEGEEKINFEVIELEEEEPEKKQLDGRLPDPKLGKLEISWNQNPIDVLLM